MELKKIVWRSCGSGETLLRQIRCAPEDEAVRAILLEVDSPGGALTPSDEIYDALRRFGPRRGAFRGGSYSDGCVRGVLCGDGG